MADFLVKTSALGASPTTLTNAVAGVPEWDVTGDARWSFRIPTTDPQATNALLGEDGWEREGELWKNGTKIFAGPIISSDAGPELTTCNVGGLADYFGSEVRQIDTGADRVNHLTDPQFEGSTGWAATGTTFTRDTAHHILGAKSAKLVAGSYDQNWYIEQTVSIASSADGELMTLAGWFKVLDSGYLGPAYQNRGLWLFHDQGGVDLGVFEIDDETPRDQWLRAEVFIWIPANVTADVEVRCYSVGGTIHWDALSLTKMESLSTAHENPPGTFVPDKDEAVVAGDIISFLQASPWSDLDITKSISTTGTRVERAYQHADHVGGREALDELTGMGRFEWSIGPDRVFRTHPGGKGTDRTATVTLTLNDNCVLRPNGKRRDGHSGASTVVALGEGDGPDREEGSAKDATAFGGVTVQEIFTPPGTAPIDSLDPTAATRLATKKKPRIMHLRVVDETLADTLEEGDTVTLDIDHGYASAAGAWRIVKRSIPVDDGPDWLDIELNPAV